MTTLNASEQRQLLSALVEIEPGQRQPRDGRRHKRWGVVQWLWVCGLARETGQRAQLFKVLLRDASAGGIGFFSRRPIKRGAFIVASLRFTEGGGRLVLARITFSKSIDKHHWAMGAQFIEHLEDPGGKATVPQEWVDKALCLGHGHKSDAG